MTFRRLKCALNIGFYQFTDQSEWTWHNTVIACKWDMKQLTSMDQKTMIHRGYPVIGRIELTHVIWTIDTVVCDSDTWVFAHLVLSTEPVQCLQLQARQNNSDALDTRREPNHRKAVCKVDTLLGTSVAAQSSKLCRLQTEDRRQNTIDTPEPTICRDIEAIGNECCWSYLTYVCMSYSNPTVSPTEQSPSCSTQCIYCTRFGKHKWTQNGQSASHQCPWRITCNKAICTLFSHITTQRSILVLYGGLYDMYMDTVHLSYGLSICPKTKRACLAKYLPYKRRIDFWLRRGRADHTPRASETRVIQSIITVTISNNYRQSHAIASVFCFD